MAYIKTEWVDGENKYSITDQAGNIIPGFENIKLLYTGTGGTPLSQEKMNKIEQGIKGVEASIENIAYDLYLMWLQEYYSTSLYDDADTLGDTRAIIVNGFSSVTEYNATLTDAKVVTGSTLSERVTCTSPDWTIESTTTALNFNTTMAMTDTFDWTNPQYAAGAINPETYAVSTMDSSGTEYGTIRFDLGSIKTIEHFEIYVSADGDDFSYEYIKDAKFSTDGSTYTTAGMSDKVSSYQSSENWHRVSWAAPTPVRYVVLQIATYQGGAGSSTHRVYDSRGLSRTDIFVPRTLVSAEKSLTFSPSSIVGYFSDNVPDGTDIDYFVSTDGGVNWTQGVEVDSWPDPKVATCIERKINFANLPVGTQLVIKAELTPTTGMSGVTPAISRYGLFIYE